MTFWVFVLGMWIGIGLGYLISKLTYNNKKLEKELEILTTNKSLNAPFFTNVTREDILRVNDKLINQHKEEK